MEGRGKREGRRFWVKDMIQGDVVVRIGWVSQHYQDKMRTELGLSILF